jgi:hypothetical protein
MPPKIRYHERLIRYWPIVLGLAVLFVVACISLWRFPFLRPYVAGFGAAFAALLSPLLALIPPKGRSDWILIGVIAGLIGLGTWYSMDAIERDRDALQSRIGQLNERRERQQQAYATTLKALPDSDRAIFILGAARQMRQLYAQSKFEPVLDLAALLADVDQENGHALYYEGEAYRSLGSRTFMRGALQRYLAAADRHVEAEKGPAAECYEHPSGYCGERTAWINHLMANDYYNESPTSNNLGTAFKYEQQVLAIRPQGFYGLKTIKSSCDLLQRIADGIRGSGQNLQSVLEVLQRYRAKNGPC